MVYVFFVIAQGIYAIVTGNVTNIFGLPRGIFEGAY